MISRILSLVLGLLAVVPVLAQKMDRPNVILIYSDDQGATDLNIYGSKDLQTPNLDQLARISARIRPASLHREVTTRDGIGGVARGSRSLTLLTRLECTRYKL